jgi:sugar/nucleoside kinase (ribokinase family)
MKAIELASKVCLNLKYPDNMRGGAKYDPVAQEAGGFCVAAAGLLEGLRHHVTLYGRFTDDDEPLRRQLEAYGVTWKMQKVDGPGARNAVLNVGGEPLILRVSGTPGSWSPTAEEGTALSRSKAAAMALGGSMNSEYAEFFLNVAAGRGVPLYYNASASADLCSLGAGEVYLQVSYAEFGTDQVPPRELATQLLVATGAAGCVVTDSVRGSYGILRGDKVVLHAPAIELPAHKFVRSVGAGDAFFAGFLVGMLNAPRGSRLERGLHLGRLLAAWHVAAMPAVSWSELRRFEQQFFAPPRDSVRVAA